MVRTAKNTAMLYEVHIVMRPYKDDDHCKLYQIGAVRLKKLASLPN